MHGAYDREWCRTNSGYHNAMRKYRHEYGSVPDEIRLKLREVAYGKGPIHVREVFARAGIKGRPKNAVLDPSTGQKHRVLWGESEPPLTRAERKARIPPEDRLAPELPDPCTLDSPALDYLPGWACAISLFPKGCTKPLVDVDYQRMRLLHACLSSYLGGVGHSRRGDLVQALPSAKSPGRIYWTRTSRETVMGDSARVVRNDMLGGEPFTVVLENPMRVRAPKPFAAGQYRLRISSIQPVVHTRSILTENGYGRKKGESIIEPTGVTLQQTLNRVAEILGLTVPNRNIQISVLGCDTEPVDCFVGGIKKGKFQRGWKTGHVIGWVGVIDVECNAVAAWLLKCAEIVALGGSSSLGFGRVRVEPMPTDKKKQIAHAPAFYRFRATYTAMQQFRSHFAPTMDPPAAAKALESVLARAVKVSEMKDKHIFESSEYPGTKFVSCDDGTIVSVTKESRAWGSAEGVESVKEIVSKESAA